MSEQTVVSTINKLVATQGVFFVKLHQYHWYVQGPGFFILHEKFEEYYDESNEYFDAFAERLITLGEKPYSTLAEYLEHSVITEQPYDKKMSQEEMVRSIVADYRTIRDVARQGVELAGDAGDTGSEDMFIDYIDSIDLNIWMLQAYLGEDATAGE